MMRVLRHLLFLSFLLNWEVSSAPLKNRPKGMIYFRRRFPYCEDSPSSQPLLPCDEVHALEELVNDLGAIVPSSLVNRSFCSESYRDIGSLRMKCLCNSTACHIQQINSTRSIGSSADISSSYSSSTATISHTVAGLQSLQILILSNMGLQSSIPNSLGDLSALEYLDLSYNHLSGDIPISIGNLSSLKVLDLSNNQLSGSISIQIGSMDSLESLNLGYNLLEGSIPDLKSLVNLKTLSLRVNRLTGQIPDALGKQIFKLEYLALNENRLSGTLQPELGKLTQLKTFDVGSNNLGGNITSTMFDQLPYLEYFGVYGNNLDGKIPRNIANSRSLEKLVLIGNNFDGPVPDEIFQMGNLKVLSITDLHMKSDIGLPRPEFVNLTSIQLLTLRNCNLSGKIPDYIQYYIVNLTLGYLDLSFNHLDNNLAGNLTRDLYGIALGSNTLGGQSFQSPGPRESKNIWVPSCSKGNHRTSLFINCGGGELPLNGTLYENDNDTANWQSTNEDMQWAYSCRGLSYSYETVKNLSCAVGFSDTTLYATARVCPVSLKYYGFCFRNGKYNVFLHFAEIEYVKNEDYSILRKRIFDVYIQNELKTKDFVIVRDPGTPSKDVTLHYPIEVTNNTLEIHLYWAGKGTLVDTNDFNGVLISAITVTPFVKPGLKPWQIALIVLSCVIFLGIIILALAWQWGWIGNKELYEKRIDIRGKKFTVKQLIKATQNFSRKKEIGSGGFGAVYKAELAGQVIAVKKLSPRSKQGILEFRRELYSLKSLRHPNFVELLDGYSGHGFHLLIYEYMENKSLADVLFDPQSKQKLNWQVRYKICKDIAIGLKYLHEESHLNMIHGDIKASNILLDGELNAKISDFGLAKIYTEDDQATVVKVGGTTGYMAPEYASQGLLSHKADVYSFGVVLLEIVSGRKNAEYKPSEESEFLLDTAYVLHKKGKSMSLVDEVLVDDLTEQQSNEAKSVLLLAMMCVSLSPSLRPTMSEVVSVLEGEKTIEQVSDEYAVASTSRSIGNTGEKLGRRNWSSADYTPGSTDTSSTATTTYYVIKEKDGKKDQPPSASLEIAHDTKK